ncbi:MAG: FCSD flavin-binding domain-containing protein [Dongiaceae bacterium]
MNRWSRRRFTRLAGTIGLVAMARPTIAQGKARVVIVGGGPGGATVAKYLAETAPSLAVTLVEANAQYRTCFFSNLYLAGLRPFDSLAHGYATLRTGHGIDVVHDSAIAVDPGTMTVRLAGGRTLPYDRLVMAPGIDFRYDAIEGYGESAAKLMPHAWRGGEQARLLREQLEAMPDGGLFVLVAPPDPFRCPPGPYERVSLIADYFRREKPKAKILVLDSKNKFSKQALFQDAWAQRYPGMVEWLPADFTGGVKAVVPNERAVKTADETFEAAVANVIPPQTAGRITLEAGLADDSGWCPVDPNTLESRLQPGIHLVGDAIIPGEMPKSAFAANSQAKVCAMAVAAALTGSRRFEARFFNTCWSFLAADDAVRVGASYAVVDGKIAATKQFISKTGESADTRAATARQAVAWYSAITADMFA